MRRLLERLNSFAAPSDRWLSVVLVSAAAIALGYALQISNGTLHPKAITLLIFSIGCAVLAVAHPRIGFLEKLGDTPAAVVLGAGLMLGLTIHLTTPPGVYLRIGNEGYVEHHEWVAVIAILAGAGLSPTPWLGKLRTVLLLAAAFMLGLWLLKASPSPFIDVWVWHREAFQVLARGENPYAMTMPNIYGTTEWFAPGLADASRVFVGYPYPPLTFGLGAMGHLAADDYRYANLVALVASAGLIAFCRPGRVGHTAAAILILSPRSLFVLEQGWTEATAILAFATTVFCACRLPRLLPWAFGAMLATKQYFVLCAPLGLLLLPQPLTLRNVAGFAWRAAVIPVALTLPFFAWGPKAFLDSVVLFQAKQPFRPDSLSIFAWTVKGGVPQLPLWTGFFALVPAYLLSWLRAPRTPFGFAASCGLMFVLFFAFSKQAFCNYYFFIVAIFCAAAASANPTPTSADKAEALPASTVGTETPTAPS